MYLLGRHVFGSLTLDEQAKCRAFRLTVRRILDLCAGERVDSLSFYYRAAMLGRLYRFVVEQELLHGGIAFDRPRPIAFFPGTFDPFTLSHKGVVRSIRDAGFEVLLAIDEFSWSKRTQPYRIRREIAAMSVADEFHVHIFPEDFPVNIANPKNLKRCRGARSPSWSAATWWFTPPPTVSLLSRIPFTASTMSSSAAQARAGRRTTAASTAESWS